jgi:hypothetical protein
MSMEELGTLRRPLLWGIALLLLGIIGFACVGWITVKGSQVVVWQDLGGVREQTNRDGTYFYSRLTTTPYVYDVSSDTFIVSNDIVQAKNDYTSKEEQKHNQPDVPPVEIPVQMERLTEKDVADGKTTGPTTVKLECTMQYHLDTTTIVKLHRDKTHSYRTVFLKDIVLNSVITKTTILDARTVYQGDGRVRLQQAIEAELRDSVRLREYGIIVEQFIIRGISIEDKTFLEKMTAEARAEQDRKTAEKQKDAFDAQALAEEARVMAEKLRRLVEAETKKGEMVANAEANKQQQVLAAQAEFEKVRLAAEAQKERDRLEGEGLRARKEAEASGVLALGKAEAEAQRLKLEAYKGEGGQRFAEVEKAKAFGSAFSNVRYFPSDMKFFSIGKEFMDVVKSFVPQVPEDKK